MKAGVLFAGVLLAAGATPADAQTTGSSFGGGSFSRRESASGSAHGSGSGWAPSSSSSSSSWSSSSSDSWSSGSGSGFGSSSGSSSFGSDDFGSSAFDDDDDDRWDEGSSRRSSGGGDWGQLVFLAIGGLFMFAVTRLGRSRPRPRTRRRFDSRQLDRVIRQQHTVPDVDPGHRERMDVSILQVGLDWRVRPFLQRELERLARSGDTSTDTGLARLLREAALLLRRCETGWRFAHVRNMEPTYDTGRAEEAFRRATADARSRFRHELVRAYDGSLREGEGPRAIEKDDDGDGFVVVTLAVATWREVPDVLDVSDRDSLRALLQRYVAIDASMMGALEVIWSPAREDDRVSSAELQSLYPELVAIQGPRLGKVFCGYCGGPFAQELTACPHCGAPTATPVEA